jgi:hypothetical protein
MGDRDGLALAPLRSLPASGSRFSRMRGDRRTYGHNTGGSEMNVDRFLNGVRASVEKAGVFAEVKIDRGMLTCAARDAAEPAWYRLEPAAGDGWRVSLVTPDRWLSESIEADLMHAGDPIEELIEEELVEQGYRGEALTVKHFRSDDMLYTFVSPLPIESAAREEEAIRTATQCLLAYEAAFRDLGDMSGGEEQ